MKIYELLLRFIIVSVTIAGGISCRCQVSKIIHADFCDVLNDPSKDIEHKTPNRIFQEKTLYFIVNEKNPRLISDSMIHYFIKNDEFIQNEIYNIYNRLRIVFYKKSELTDQMLKQKSSSFLPYCNKDILFEYGWENGKPSDTLYFENGAIKGSENIRLINPDTVRTNK